MNSSMPSGPALAVLAVLAVVQVTLLVVGLVTWLRTPEGRFAGNRYLWLVLVLAVGVIGPVVFLVAGRRPEQATDPAPVRGEVPDRTASAVDDLYGGRDR